MRSHAYRLLNDSPAKKKAKKLVEIVELMGFSLKLSRAQALVAGMMGYDDWSELSHAIRSAPERGVPDQMLPPKAAAERRKFQIAILRQEFNIEDFAAKRVLEVLAPTGEGAGRDWPTVEKLGLRLSEEDVVWLNESMSLVREFDATVRPLYALSKVPDYGLTCVQVENIERGRRKFYNRRATSADDIVRWVESCFPESASLTEMQLVDVTKRAESACRAFSKLDARIRALGPAPMLAPIDWTFLSLSRSHVMGENSYYTPLDAEPWLHIGFDLPGFFVNPENEWNASRALALQMALRREFLDSGWTDEGPEWQVIFRDGNSAKEEITVHAKSTGAAYAWVAAARGALRIAKQQTASSISLLSVVGHGGTVDPEQALAIATNETVIRRGRLLDASKLRVRGRRKAA